MTSISHDPEEAQAKMVAVLMSGAQAIIIIFFSSVLLLYNSDACEFLRVACESLILGRSIGR